MTQPIKDDRPPTDQELLDLTRTTVFQLNLMVEKLESYVNARNPGARTRSDDLKE